MFNFFKEKQRLIIRLHEGSDIPSDYIYKEQEPYDTGGSGNYTSYRSAIDCEYGGNTPTGIMVKPFIGGLISPEEELVQIPWKFIRTITKKY